MNSLFQNFASTDIRKSLVGQTMSTRGSRFYVNQRGAGTCDVILEDQYIVYIFEPDRDPEPWFGTLCTHVGDRPEIAAEVPAITYKITKVQEDHYGRDEMLPLKAIPLALTEQSVELQDYIVEIRKNVFGAAQPEAKEADQVSDWVEKPENTGKCDQRPRGRKDSDLMALVRVAARRAGYIDDTASASYSPFINAVLWLAAEEGLLFRVRHAIMDSKGGDAHYTND